MFFPYFYRRPTRHANGLKPLRQRQIDQTQENSASSECMPLFLGRLLDNKRPQSLLKSGASAIIARFLAAGVSAED
jgi:hypothetical protein